jgi:Glycine/sarcosine/betaine reductase selenoprotein B (GRDB)
MDTPETDDPVGYMERTRIYYRALGYKNDYVWSTYEDVPFAGLKQPLAQSKIALVTTASPPGLTNRDEAGGKHVWTGKTGSPPASFVTEVAWDRESTHTDDRECFLPIDATSHWAQEGTIAGLAAHFVGAPTGYSQAKTMQVDAPKVLAQLQADGADAAILTSL